LEVGAGIGTNFVFYPEAVLQVIAVEPEPRLRARALAPAGEAPVPVVVTGGTAEEFSGGEPFEVVLVCSLVLCSVRDPGAVLRHLHSLLPAGVGSCGISSTWPAPVRGAACSGLSTRRSGRDCSATATRIAMPSVRSSTPDSR
jgi:SAM-dependent methyltransferase